MLWSRSAERQVLDSVRTHGLTALRDGEYGSPTKCRVVSAALIQRDQGARMIRRPDGQTFYVASCHAHLGESSLLTRFRGLAPRFHGDEMIEMLDHYGIDATVAFGMAKPTSNYEEDTAAVLKAAADYPGRIVPFARMNPHAEGNVERVEKYLTQGIKGLKFSSLLGRLP